MMILGMSIGVVLAKLALIIVLGLAIYAGIFAVIKTFGKSQDAAIQIVKERYARGEITEEEFEHQRDVLLK